MYLYIPREKKHLLQQASIKAKKEMHGKSQRKGQKPKVIYRSYFISISSCRFLYQTENM
jgi:hypothetical protein